MSAQDSSERFARVEPALAEGKSWRAKEMLQGNIAGTQYDAELYERYGLVLMLMGDMVEAGKYLFLAGRDEPNYAEAVGLYLSRHAKKGWKNLYFTFPRRARFTKIDSYPDAVQKVLQELKFSPKDLPTRKVYAQPPPTRKDAFVTFASISFMLLILLSIPVELWTIGRTIVRWIFNLLIQA